LLKNFIFEKIINSKAFHFPNNMARVGQFFCSDILVIAKKTKNKQHGIQIGRPNRNSFASGSAG
jgi:hypothetical protein